MLTPEEIVRALAASGAPLDSEYGDCNLCQGWHVRKYGDDLSVHEPTCPWRLAVEWVAEHPA